MDAMTTEIAPTEFAQRTAEHVRAQADKARKTLSDFTNRAVEILQELAEYAENDRIRLAAVNSILDRSGVTAPTEIKVTATQEEHDLVKADAEQTLERLQRNLAQREIGAPKPSLEAIIVHEGEPEATTHSGEAQ
jgi:hypothetical protein